MKSNKILKSIFALSAVVLAMAGCRQQLPDEVTTLRLSKTAYTFSAEGMENSLTINVTANNPWTVDLVNSATDSWVKIGEKTDNSVVISVDDNDGGQRDAKLIFKSGMAERTFTVSQLPLEDKFARYRDLEALITSAISPSGKYAGGYTQDYDDADQSVYTPVIIDIEKDKWYYMSQIHSSIHAIEVATAITDDGVLFFSTTSGSGTISVDLEDNLNLILSPTGFKHKPNVCQTSADGKYVGYAIKTAVDGEGAYEFGYWPILWENGEPRALERPAKTFKGYDDVWGGCMVRGISADGKVMFGNTYADENEVTGEASPSHGGVYGGMISWDKDGKVYFIGGNYKGTNDPIYVTWTEEFDDPDLGKRKINLVNGMVSQAETYNISETGKWIAGTLLVEKKISSNSVSLTHYPAFYNTEKNETTVFDDMPGRVGVTINDEGIGVIGNSTYGTTAGYVVDANTKASLGTCLEWILEKYSINVSAGYITNFCLGGETVLGLQAISGGPVQTFAHWYVTTPAKK